MFNSHQINVKKCVCLNRGFSLALDPTHTPTAAKNSLEHRMGLGAESHRQSLPWLCGQYLGVDAVGLSLRLLYTLQGHLPSLLHSLTLVILHLLRLLHLLEMEIESCQELLAQSSSDMCATVHRSLQYLCKGYNLFVCLYLATD